ncbi:ShlB/FhaC/HecB family hemolysin secretion/activation protein [Caenispirillum salinarum]|uniref:ShlB/FhaC/HecB family hemolysin secretion/activation protein n=1 Tax=Caenispirillum salinarum TaxID=859058 RepID=UPI00384C1688
MTTPDLRPRTWRDARAVSAATAIALILAVPAVPALAQSVPTGANDIDRVVERFETGPEAVASTDPVIPALPDQTEPPPGAEHMLFTLLDVEIAGDTVLDAEARRGLYAEFLGQRGPVTRLYTIADRIRSAYETRDLFAPTVIVPPQDLEDGTARLRVEPFHLDEVTVLADEDQDVTGDPVVRDIIHALRQSRPLTVTAYQQAVEAFSRQGFAVLGIETDPHPGDAGGMDAVVHVSRDAARASGTLVQPGKTPDDPPVNAKQIRFTLNDVQVSGATVFPLADLSPAWDPLVGDEVTLQQLYEAAQKIKAQYAAAGYAGTVVTLPRQFIVDGRVRLDVREMSIGSVRVVLDGEALPADSQIARMANQVAGTGLLRADMADRYTNLLRDIPGITVASVALPQEPGGEAVVTLSRDRIQGKVGLNNRGTRSIGRLQLMTGVTANGVLTDTDSLALSVVTVPTHPNELKLYTLTETMLLGLEGTKLTLSASRTHASPGSLQEPFGIDSFNTSYSARIDHPVIRTTPLNLHLWTSLEYTESETDLMWKRVEQGEDKVTAWRFGANVDWVDGDGGVTRVSGTVSNGLGAFGADDPDNTLDRPNSVPTFQKIQVEAQRNQPLPLGLTLVGEVSAQITPDVLPGSELMSFGGEGFGRAFHGGVVSGDKGWAARAELNTTITVGKPWLMGVQPFAWYDIGQFWINDSAPGTEDPKTAASTGLGVRATITPWLQGQVEVGLPLINHNTTVAGRPDSSPQVFFGVLANF